MVEFIIEIYESIVLAFCQALASCKGWFNWLERAIYRSGWVILQLCGVKEPDRYELWCWNIGLASWMILITVPLLLALWWFVL